MGFFYKKYLLRSKSVQLSETDRWAVEVAVTLKDGPAGDVREQTFSSENTFASKEMADMEGIIYARKIIDGEIDGLSVDELDRN